MILSRKAWIKMPPRLLPYSNYSRNKVMTFNEGVTIELLAVGDKSGCSFEMKDLAKNVSCCYIHEEREDTRGG